MVHPTNGIIVGLPCFSALTNRKTFKKESVELRDDNREEISDLMIWMKWAKNEQRRQKGKSTNEPYFFRGNIIIC